MQLLFITIIAILAEFYMALNYIGPLDIVFMVTCAIIYGMYAISYLNLKQ